MATVWLADDLRHDRQVALKLLHSELASSLGADRFLREIRIAARLQHPHILTVLDSGAAAGPKGGPELLWYTMPYVEGETLRSRLAREGQLPLADALRIARDVAEALDHAHAHGVIHRDIKPENILLSPGHALVADFGIAAALQSPTDDTRLTETGVVLGTPHYMSPEQAAGERALDRRTDVYSLGCVLYEMLAGEPPFTGPTQQAILAKRLSAPTPRVGTVREVPPQVDEAVTRALARAPADRYGTTAELAAALDAPATTGRASRARWRSRALVAGGLVATLVGAAVALGGRTTQRHDDAGPASAAVLPFVDLSPSKDQEYFSDGLTDELITSLSKIEGLRVAGRTSSFQFKGRNPDVRDVGRRLGVGAVLEGSVRQSGRPAPRQRPAGERARRLSALVRVLRPESRGRLRGAGGDRPRDRRGAPRAARRGHRFGARRPSHEGPRRLRPLPQGALRLEPAHRGLTPAGGELVRAGGGAGLRVHPGVGGPGRLLSAAAGVHRRAPGGGLGAGP